MASQVGAVASETVFVDIGSIERSRDVSSLSHSSQAAHAERTQEYRQTWLAKPERNLTPFYCQLRVRVTRILALTGLFTLLIFRYPSAICDASLSLREGATKWT